MKSSSQLVAWPHESESVPEIKDTAKIAAFLYRNVYSKSYSSFAYDTRARFPKEKIDEPIARVDHGIQHVSRVAMYSVAFANLYRRFGDADALALTDDDLDLIKIAALFHDAGREGDGEDTIEWEQKGATALYEYLTLKGINKEKAKMLAEAIVNKDFNGHDYYKLKEDGTWEKVAAPHQYQKNIYAKIIHDADSLDIIRVRQTYDANYLDFYNSIVNKNKNALNQDALDAMGQFIIDARGIIDVQGDSFLGNRRKHHLKKIYENENAYSKVTSTLERRDEQDFSVMYAFYSNGQLLSEEQLLTIKLKNENTEFMIARGIQCPSIIDNKKSQGRYGKETHQKTLLIFFFHKI